MFIFRRITIDDAKFIFKTGNKIFDELAPDGSLKNYIDQDIIREGKFITYLLFEKQDSEYEILGLLRYRYTSINDYTEQISLSNAPEDLKTKITQYISRKKFSIVYLSRIGVAEKYHELRISQIISNFFEFLIQRKKQNLVIYTKILEDLLSVVGSKYKVIGKHKDKKWGNYFLVSKMMEFNPNIE